MSLDFQQVKQQILRHAISLGDYYVQLHDLQVKAQELFEAHALSFDLIQNRVEQITKSLDPNIRCALPFSTPEALNSSHPAPEPPQQAAILAADGSQILPSRHREINFGLINVGAIEMQLHTSHAPETTIRSRLFYGEELIDLSEAQLALSRDLEERKIIYELAQKASSPVISFTDGPIELWESREGLSEGSFELSLNKYLETLESLQRANVVTSGYVDKPSANLVVRTLEILSLPESQLADVRKIQPLRGVTDYDLFKGLLQPGERSALFSIQSHTAWKYQNGLGLTFFYLNVGRKGHPWLARVEIPAWVGNQPAALNALHAVLLEQCRVMGTRPYPYILHRAHEAARVTLEEQKQITQMFSAILLEQGVRPGRASHKQALKDLPGRTKISRRGASR